MDYKLAGATRSSEIDNSYSLPADWGDWTETVKDWSIYAVVESGGGGSIFVPHYYQKLLSG